MKKFIIFIILFIFSSLSVFGADDTKIRIYTGNALNTGAKGSLDNLDGSDGVGDGSGKTLKDGDIAIIIVPGDQTYFYSLDSDSGATESIPDVISPNYNAGTKRWILVSVNQKGEVPFSKFHTNLTAIITAIGAIKTTLVIDESTTLIDNATPPSTLALKVQNGAVITLVAYALNLSLCPKFEGSPGCFNQASTGSVTGLKESRPEWFGLDGVADQVAINKSLAAGPTKLSKHDYLTNGAVLIDDDDYSLKGLGPGLSRIISSESGGTILKVGDGTAVYRTEIEGVGLRTNTTGSRAAIGLDINGMREGKIKNVRSSFATGKLMTLIGESWLNSFEDVELYGYASATALETGGVNINSNQFKNLTITDASTGLTSGVKFVDGVRGLFFDGISIEACASGIDLCPSTKVLSLTKIGFENVYSEIPATGYFLKADDTSYYVNVENISFDGVSLNQLGAAARDSAFDFSRLTNQADSLIKINVSNLNHHAVNITTLTRAVFDLTSKVRLNMINSTKTVSATPWTIGGNNYNIIETGYEQSKITSYDLNFPIGKTSFGTAATTTLNRLTNGGLQATPGIGQKWQAPLSATAAVAINCASGMNIYHTLTESTTIGAPTNTIDGAVLYFVFHQPAGATWTVSFNAIFKLVGGAYSMTGSGGAVVRDTICFMYSATADKWIEISRAQNIS